RRVGRRPRPDRLRAVDLPAAAGALCRGRAPAERALVRRRRRGDRGAVPHLPDLAARATAGGSAGHLIELLGQLAQGFVAALTPMNLLMCLLGVVLGQIIGVLPGIGPSAAIALLLPLTYGSSPTAAIILFAGIYYGAQYGGTLTSVLISVPGEPSTVMTSIDGYQMALQGRAGVALGIAAIGSFIAGTLGTLGLMLIAPPLSKIALAFGP